MCGARTTWRGRFEVRSIPVNFTRPGPCVPWTRSAGGGWAGGRKAGARPGVTTRPGRRAVSAPSLRRQNQTGSTPMRSAVIVSTARTPIGRAYRGAFNDTQSQALGGHVIAEAVKRAGVAPGRDRRRDHGRRAAAGRAGLQHRASVRVARRVAGHRRGHVGGPSVRLRHDGDRHGGETDLCTTTCRSPSAAGWSRSRWCRPTR